MPRPFRFQPPSRRSPDVARARLRAQLDERWTRRLVTVQAGPGFGKTTLLTSMLDAGGPDGETIWLTCQPDDESADNLIHGIADALGLGGPASVEAILDAVWAKAPIEVCLVLDDVHEIPARSGGAEVVSRIVTEMSANGHLVMASRDAFPVPLGRLAASGQLVRIGEDELLFDDAELAEFATVRAVEIDLLQATGGWPAIAELVAATSSDLVPEYLWAEVLAGMDSERADLLARFAVVGGGDAQVLQAIGGRDASLDDLVAAVPLVQRDDDGWVALHPLWAPALRARVPAGRASDDRRRAAEAHARAGRYRIAADLLADDEAWTELLALIPVAAGHIAGILAGGATEQTELDLTPGDFGQWRAALPPHLRDEPEALLAGGVHLASHAPAEAAPLFAAAVEGFRQKDHVDDEVEAIFHEGFIRWWLNDQGRLFELHLRAAELGDRGSAGALVLTAIAEAAIAHLSGDPDTVFERLSGVDAAAREWIGPVRWLRSVAHRQRGDLARSLAELDERAVVIDDAQTEIARLRVRWLQGDVDAAVSGFAAIQREYDPDRDTFLWRETTLETALKHAWLGEADAAAHLLAETTGTHPTSPSALASVLDAATRAALAVAVGDDAAAARIVQDEARAGPAAIGTGADWYWTDRATTALLVVLVPDVRDAIRRRALSPAHRPGLDLAEALLASRDGDEAGVRELVWPPSDVARVHLPSRWLVELALAAHIAGNPPGDDLLLRIGPPATAMLRAIAEVSDAPTARTALRLARTIPTPPVEVLRVEVVGPLRLLRGGVTVEDALLDRRRVRELLCLLVLRRRVHREVVADELWPDVGDPAHNLSVTLNYLQRVLEPDRHRDDPPYFIRSEGDWLELTGGELLEVDVWELDACIGEERTSDRDGSVPALLTAGRRARSLWRGEPFVDVLYADWAEGERARLRRRFVATQVRSGELLLAASSVDEAREAATAALTTDPSSEPAARVLARTHLAEGDRAAALDALDRCARALAELDLVPDDATLELRRRIGARP